MYSETIVTPRGIKWSLELFIFDELGIFIYILIVRLFSQLGARL